MRNMTSKAMAIGLMGILAMAAPAKAGDFALTIGIEGPRGNHLDLTIGNGCITPVFTPAPPVVVVQPVERFWVPPVYRDVIEQVWVPCVETRYRDVPVYDIYGQIVAYRREAYTVDNGHWQNVTRRELVREGFWQIVNPTPYPQKRYYGIGAWDDHGMRDMRARPMIEDRDRHDRPEPKGGPMIGKLAMPKVEMKNGPAKGKAMQVKDSGIGKVVKAVLAKAK